MNKLLKYILYGVTFLFLGNFVILNVLLLFGFSTELGPGLAIVWGFIVGYLLTKDYLGM